MAVTIGNQWVLKSRIVNRDPFSGSTVVETIEGTADAIAAFIPTLTNPEASWVLDDSQAPRWRLIVTTPQNDEVSWFWEMPGNSVQEGIIWHPRSLGMPPDLIKVINNAIQAIDEGQFTVAEQITNIQNFIDTLSIADKATLKAQAVNLFLYMYRRKDIGADYLKSQYTLRLTQIVANNYALQISDVGIEKIYSNGQLGAEANANGTPIPARLAYKIDHLPVQQAVFSVDGVVDTTYQWGWLKLTSSERQTPTRRVEIVTEWWLDLWSLYAYDTL